MDTWKEFDQNVVSHSAAHHLMAIDNLLQTHGYARVSDVARQLNITRGSVSISLQPLKRAGLVIQDENRHLRLSERGQALADSIRTKRVLMQRFFSDVLGVDPVQAEVDACKLEHLISNTTARHLISFLRFFNTEAPVARQFRDAWAAFDPECSHEPRRCSSCEGDCLVESIGD